MKENVSIGPVEHETFSSAIVDAHNYIEWILSKFSPYLRGRIMEVGIGHGSYSEYVKPYGSYLGIDIDQELVEAACKRYPETDFATADIVSPGFSEVVAPGSLDAILSCNVLEHIEDDKLALRNLSESLKSSGHLLVLVPALGYLYNDLDRLAGHHRRYDIAMMQNAIQGLPLRVKEMSYFNPLGGAAWFANRLIRHRTLNSDNINQQIRIFDRYVLPVSRFLDPLSRKIFGQSLILVAEKL